MQAGIKFRAGIIGASLSFFLILQLLTKYPTFVEKYYSNGVYPILTLFISSITNQLPMSLSEVSLWVLVLIVVPLWIRKLLKGRVSFGRWLLNLGVVLSLIVVWFYLAWGINYLRVPLSSTLKLDRVALPIGAFDSTLVEVIDRANALNLSYSIKSVEEINEIVEASYKEVLPALGLPTVPGPKVIKEFTGNWMLNKTTTSGWFSPFFHEVHYNNDLLVIELPFVIAHEKAHQMGFTNEAECNFLAYLVCTHASEPLVRYSGYFSVLGYFLLNTPKNKKDRAFFVDRINEGVKLDLAAVRERWKSHQGLIANISTASYDLYLKANKVKEGTRSYSGVVDMIIKYDEQKRTKTAQK